MSRIPFHRPVRMTPPPMPEGKITLAAPPQRPQPQGAAGWLMLLLPLLSSMSMAAYMVAYGRAWMILLGIAFVVVSVGITIGVRMQLRAGRRRNQFRQRERYFEYLAGIRKQVLHTRAAQRAADTWRHPHPDRLWAMATRGRRVWERRPGDQDFLHLRLGTGTVPLARSLHQHEQHDPTTDLDLRSQHAAAELVQTYGTLGDQAAWFDLGSCGVVSLLGPRPRTRRLAQSLLLQLSVLHAPDDVRVAVVTGGNKDWDWAKWLPHAQEPGTDPQRREQEVVPLLADSLAELHDHLRQSLDQEVAARAERLSRLAATRDNTPRRRLVVLLDDYDPAQPWTRTALLHDLLSQAGPDLGLHVVCLVEEEGSEPGRVDVRARADARGGLVLEGRAPGLHAQVERGVADAPEDAVLEAAARALAPLRLSGERDQVLSEHVSLSEMLGVPDVSAFDPAARRRTPDARDLLSVPIGVTGSGSPLVMDLKESAQGGIGPHGLVVGATGSGKSELLRTLVTGMAMVHSPDHLAFVLVDFKGGATFAGVTELPHVSGLITNLADDLALVDRMRQALQGEQQRRQRLLREAGNVDSVREYQLRQAAGGTDLNGKPLEPLPYLVVVVDEFGELLSQRPDFIELFVQIGRVGRSLGIHLLLATQRLEEGRLRGLESHLSYRICLRTFSAAESRAVIGTPDAYTLPAIPGSAYLKVDESVYERFRVAHISAPYHKPGNDEPSSAEPVPFAVHGDLPPLTDDDNEKPGWEWDPDGGATELEIAVERLLNKDTPGHQVWLPPLPARFGLTALLGEPEPEKELGLRCAQWPYGGELKFPVGVLDVPTRQEQRPLVLDLAGRQGHLALVGAPQSGKSTFLRTAMLSAMLTHTPDEVQFYCVDMGGGTLHGLADAPHVAGVAGRRDEERVRRVLAEVSRIVAAREKMFRDLRIQSSAELRTRRAEGRLPDGVRAADIVLVIDNWAALHSADENAITTLTEIATRGLGVGVHLWITANRWAEIRVNLRDNIPGRLELRLNDPSESEINRPAARALGQSVPGRGLATPGLTHHIALPRLDGDDSTDGLADAEQHLVERLAEAWTRPAAPELRVLPSSLTVRDLARAEAPSDAERWDGHGPAIAPHEVPIGLRESDLRPVGLDMTAGAPHFVVFGDSGSGKTAFLHTWMRGLADRHSARDLRFMVVDYRHSLLGVVPEEYIGARGGSADLVAGQAQALAETLRSRIPPADITAGQLASRGWWQGPELYVVADDYDLAAGGMGRGPLAPLAEFIPQAAELGFHLVLARRAGGASRAVMSDPLLSKLKEIGTDGLLLSGDHREGALIAEHRARRRPPGRGQLVRHSHEPVLVQIALPESAAPHIPRPASEPPAPAPSTKVTDNA